MLPLPPLWYETVTLPSGERRNEMRVQPLSALLDHLEDSAGRSQLGRLLARGGTTVIRLTTSPYPLIVHAGRAYAWQAAGWENIRLRPQKRQVVTTYDMTTSHLTLSLLRDALDRSTKGPSDPASLRYLAQCTFLCPLTLLGVPGDLAARVGALLTPQDENASWALRPPDQR